MLKLSLRQKIQGYACLVAISVLVIAGAALIIYDFKVFQEREIQRLNQKITYLQQTSAPFLANNQRAELAKSISTISRYAGQIGVWIFDQNLHQVAAYDPFNYSAQKLTAHLYAKSELIQDHHLILLRDIYFGENFVGKVLIAADLRWLQKHSLYQLKIIFFAGAASLFFAWLLFYSLQSSLILPLQELVQNIRKIREQRVYQLPPFSCVNNLEPLREELNKLFQEIEIHKQALTKNEERLSLALWASNEIMFDWDIKNNHCDFTKNYDRLLGYAYEEMPRTKEDYFALIHPYDRAQVEERLQEHFLGKEPIFKVGYRLQCKTGDWRWTLVRGKVVERDKYGRPLRMVGTFTDISYSKHAEEKLKLFSKVVESINEGVLIISPQLDIVEVNPAFCAITGYSRNEIIGQPLALLQSNQQKDGFYQRLYHSLKMKGYWQGELWEKRKNGEVYAQRLTISSMNDEQNKLIHYVAVLSDVTHYRQVQDEINYLTHYDPLTRLPNRTLLMAQLDAASQRAQVQNKKIALIFVGVDNFKIINDSYGHEIGDVLLQAVAKRLMASLEEKGSVARITGDEFAIVREHFGDRLEVIHYVQHILAIFSAHFKINEHQILLGVSIGVSFFPEDANNIRELFLQADTALYHAKQAGRNTYKLYSPQMNQQMQTRHKMEVLLRCALASDEFSLLYQPKICAKTGKICGAEALLRWHNTQIGPVEPGVFIRIAEESGVIVPLGKWTLEAACKQTKKWLNMGFDIQISVNLSAYQFRVSGLIDTIATILDKTQLPASALELEITESVLMENAERCLLLLSVMKSMGITISVDDFGTGYSSLSYLRRFTIDTLKIDRSFINTVCTNKEDANIVRAIIAMAKGLKILTVAEGVETQEQVNFLIQEGIDELQGFYFDKPLTAEEFTARLKEDPTWDIEAHSI